MRSIMLVEDHAEARAALTRVLETRGYTVLECEDGRDALVVAHGRRIRPDLIVFNVVRSVDWDVFHVAQAKDPLLAGVPVVLAQQARATTLPDVVKVVLSPPLKLRDLLQAIDACLGVTA